MEEHHQLPLNQIIQGDCLDIMKQFPDNSIDLVVTSPPYDNLRAYNGYVFSFNEVAKQLFRVTKDGGVVVWVVNDAVIDGSESGTSFSQALHFKEIGFKLHDTMIYYSTKLPQNHMRYEQSFEYMFVFVKNKIKTFNGLLDKRRYPKDRRKNKNCHRNKLGEPKKSGSTKQSKYVLRYNVWSIPSGGGISTKDSFAYKHPAIFPEKLAEDHILSWSNIGDIVLDPMCGSGTTCKMAVKNMRKFVGIDVSEEYCDISRKRVELWLNQTRLDE